MTLTDRTFCADELVALLERLLAHQQELGGVIQAKLAAMRSLNVDAMLAAAAREGELADAARILDLQRRQIVARACAQLGLPGADTAAGVTLRMIVARLQAPGSTGPAARILALAARLREKMLETARANQVVEMVCREMMLHFKAVFAAFAQRPDRTITYASDGQPPLAATAQVLDAVG